jgi:glycosyltransferase involved in cell wall biosynthesis
MKNYPKVLIMIETFNKQSGGGITLSNLFKGWDRRFIANAVTMHSAELIDGSELNNNYYCLGKDEFKVKFPFSLYFKFKESGKLELTNRATKTQENNKPQGIKAALSKAIGASIDWIKTKLNLTNYIYSMDVSPGLLQWIEDFTPDYIYVQPSSRYYIKFFKKLHEVTGIPLVMHIMDDWQKAIDTNSLLHTYWEKKIDKEFRELLNSTSVFLSISDGMSNEYYQRYGKKFIPFHNTIDIDQWLPYSKKDYKINKPVRILYAGRIGRGTYHSFVDFILAVEDLNREGNDIKLHIQTTTSDDKLRKKLENFSCVIFNEMVGYDELAKVFSSYDILLLPIDFDKNGKAFLKYSMPTKAAEFMISGTPVLLFCPEDIALYEHATLNKWAYVISSNDRDVLKKGILELMNDEELRKRLSNTAKNYAIEHFDGNVVRTNFREVFK